MRTWKTKVGWVLCALLALTSIPLVSLSQAPVPSDRALLRVKVPAGATITIDTAPTRQAGSDRLYITPPLAPGKTFTYEVQATWREAGLEKRINLQASVKAGEQTVLDFTAPQTAAVTKGPPSTVEPKKIETPKPPVPPITKKEPEPKKIDAPKPPIPPITKKEPEPKKIDAPKPPVPPITKKEPEPKKIDAPKPPVPPVTKKEPEPKKIDAPKPPVPPVTKKEPEPKKTPDQTAAKSRSFLFTYAGKVKDLKPDQEAKVWLPVAVNTPEQEVAIDSKELPAKERMGKDKEYGNSMLFFQAKADKDGEIPFKVVYRVTRREVKTDAQANVTLKPQENKQLIDRFLEPDAMVPTSGKPLELIAGKKLPNDQFAAARVLYDVVNNHMKYSKEGTGWGKGDAVWACDSKFGNCTDFHSLFISMARGNKIPSKFEMGFPLPPKHGAGPIGGYHCWAWFMPNAKGWVPVDISEANRNPDLREYYFGNLTEDRVVFTKGRDLILDPPQDGPALNFLIYPYVEVAGQPYAADKIQRSFAFEDVAGK